MYGGTGHWFWGTLMMVLFWGGLVAVVLVLARGWSRWDRRPDEGGPPSASRILDERFARGEISADEYRERRAVLDQGS